MAHGLNCAVVRADSQLAGMWGLLCLPGLASDTEQRSSDQAQQGAAGARCAAAPKLTHGPADIVQVDTNCSESQIFDMTQRFNNAVVDWQNSCPRKHIHIVEDSRRACSITRVTLMMPDFAQLAFSMVPTSVATCQQLYNACVRALADSQASIALSGQQSPADAAWTSPAQQVT